MYTCEYCLKEFLRLYNLERHQKKVKKCIQSRVFVKVCEGCKVEFKNKTAYDDHLKYCVNTYNKIIEDKTKLEHELIYLKDKIELIEDKTKLERELKYVKDKSEFMEHIHNKELELTENIHNKEKTKLENKLKVMENIHNEEKTKLEYELIQVKDKLKVMENIHNEEINKLKTIIDNYRNFVKL